MKTRLEVLNIWVDPVTMDGALALITDYVEHGHRLHTVFAANPEKNFSVPSDPLLYQAFKNADLLIPDGIGVVLALRALYGVRIQRVTGVELMANICRLAADRGYRVFLYGAREEVNAAAADTLRERFPGLIIAGRAHGYLQEDRMPELVERINTSTAQILFLALGSPKQEMWLASHGPSLTNVRVCQGIGGTLDAVTGNVKRAPDIWLTLGLEWFYRLASEPRRWQRQKVLPLFALHVLSEYLRRHAQSARKNGS